MKGSEPFFCGFLHLSFLTNWQSNGFTRMEGNGKENWKCAVTVIGEAHISDGDEAYNTRSRNLGFLNLFSRMKRPLKLSPDF